MTIYSALTSAQGREAAAALAEAIEALEPEPSGVCVVEIEDGSGHWEVGGYFTEAPDGIGLALLAAAHGAPDFVVSEVPDTDWVAQVRRELVPVVAGRFYLHGSHDQSTVPAGSVKLLIEAAMAFGTGHHGTTLGCLLAIDRMATGGFAPRSVADIGCGTAVLAMAAAAVWPGAAILAATSTRWRSRWRNVTFRLIASPTGSCAWRRRASRITGCAPRGHSIWCWPIS